MGVFGMLLAVPLAATVYKLVQADVRNRNYIMPEQAEEENEKIEE